jgi:hypothetical protein
VRIKALIISKIYFNFSNKEISPISSDDIDNDKIPIRLEKLKHEIIELKQSKTALEIDYDNEKRKNKLYEKEIDELKKAIQVFKIKEISESEKMLRLEISNLNNTLEFRIKENDLLRKENEMVAKQLKKYESYFKDFIENNMENVKTQTAITELKQDSNDEYKLEENVFEQNNDEEYKEEEPMDNQYPEDVKDMRFEENDDIKQQILEQYDTQNDIGLGYEQPVEFNPEPEERKFEEEEPEKTPEVTTEPQRELVFDEEISQPIIPAIPSETISHKEEQENLFGDNNNEENFFSHVNLPRMPQKVQPKIPPKKQEVKKSEPFKHPEVKQPEPIKQPELKPQEPLKHQEPKQFKPEPVKRAEPKPVQSNQAATNLFGEEGTNDDPFSLPKVTNV